ncbi:MAG: class I SAM-dependent methyltransferase [Candidatus Binatia bacterium]|nr:class I SAM-dependent methyltransferase [Candidatus Binatia bacterium]
MLDFGSGRKLERFGDVVLDRPCPAAETATVLDEEAWSTADARYERAAGESGRWVAAKALPERWDVRHHGLRFEVRPTPFGHVGLFAEQAENWTWLAQQCRRFTGSCTVLNLFAYTGGSTLAAAAAGASVVHIDSAKNVNAWARRNAEASGLSDAPLRWIAEDAAKFVAREVRRGNRYDGVILDPPSYGHGPKGERWKIDEDLPPLLIDCARLVKEDRGFVLLSSHSPRHPPKVLGSLVEETFRRSPPWRRELQSLTIDDPSGRHLASGNAVRVVGGEG